MGNHFKRIKSSHNGKRSPLGDGEDNKLPMNERPRTTQMTQSNGQHKRCLQSGDDV